jgi:hypothetical protein
METTSIDNDNGSKKKSSFKDVLTKVVDAVKTPFKKNKDKSDTGSLEDNNYEKTKKRSPVKTKNRTKNKSKDKTSKKLPAKTRAPLAPMPKKRSPAKSKKQ